MNFCTKNRSNSTSKPKNLRLRRAVDSLAKSFEIIPIFVCSYFCKKFPVGGCEGSGVEGGRWGSFWPPKVAEKILRFCYQFTVEND